VIYRASPALAAWLVLACVFASVPVAARAPAAQLSKVQEIKDLKDLTAVLAEPGASRPLLVLDIDDTLLTSAEFFGSDSWYEWQKTLPAGHPALVPCRFDLIAMNYEAGVQKETQPGAAAYINSLKVEKLIQTSRSLPSRAATIRELEAAGYVLPPALSQKLDGTIFPWDPTIPASPTISYHRGVLMGAGQDKGKLLVRVLKQAGLKYDRVILVDDGFKNIENMRVALEAEGIEYRGLYYTKIVKVVSPDQERLATQGWLEWQHLLATTFPDRLERLKDPNGCGYK
jgi:hypothetical protein